MRLAFFVLVAVAPLRACSDAFVTAPPPVAPAATIVIRGAHATDGVLLGRIADINPADIEQVEIIKGPAAATLYAEMRCPPIIIHIRRQPSTSRVDRGASSVTPNDLPGQPSAHGTLGTTGLGGRGSGVMGLAGVPQ